MSDVHRRNKSDYKTVGIADNIKVCLVAKLVTSSEKSSDTTRLSKPSIYMNKATAKALNILSRNNQQGFFLTIESAIIDGYGHNNDSEGLIEKMKEFDQILKQLVAYVN